MPSDKYRHLKQSITVSSFDDKSMANVMSGVTLVATYFKEAIREVDEVDLPCRVYSGGYECFLAMNRYLTPIAESDGVDEQPMPADIDPTRRLRQVIGGDYVYTSDNEVAYTEMVVEGDTTRCISF
jgi:hypothetical protein